LELMIWW